MFAGHIGAGLALARAEPRMNAAGFVAAALLLDALLWLLVLLGVESVAIPPDFARRHQPWFDFPWSHGLAGAFGWSIFGAGIAWLATMRLGRARGRAAGLAGLAVFSHWLLDALVHRPELPMWGRQSPMVGLALWDSLPLALGIEALLAVGGMALWLRGNRLPGARRVGVAVLLLLLLGFTILGMTIAPPPPSAAAMAGSSLFVLLLVCALFAWLCRPARAGA